MERETLKFYELEGEDVKGKFKVTHLNLKKIIALFVGGAILLIIQIYLWSDPENVI